MNDLNIEGSKIMIVDDTPQNLGVLEKMLAEKGYHVFAMTSGEAAIKSAAASRPELILLDVVMSGVNGYETCRKLKENPEMRDVAVIFLSAMNETEDKLKGFEAGGVDYITKPFQLDEVMARVKTHLTVRKLQKELQKHNEHLETLVAERTRELEHAYKRVKNLERLKGEFLSMISHELRTPLNGVLVIGELIFQERQKMGMEDGLEELYQRSRLRIEQLLDDASFLNDIDVADLASVVDYYPLDAVFEGQNVRISLEMEAGTAMPKISGDIMLLKKAVDNILKTAKCFNRKNEKIVVNVSVAAEKVLVRFRLEEFSVSEENVRNFFELASIARQSSAAQEQALAPVVAKKIFELFGADIKMARLNDCSGEFVLSLPVFGGNPAVCRDDL
jgi:DNA-binding response OmpR family regulator